MGDVALGKADDGQVEVAPRHLKVRERGSPPAVETTTAHARDHPPNTPPAGVPPLAASDAVFIV